MAVILIAPPEGTFWKLEGPQDDLTLALTRKKDYATIAHCEVPREYGHGAIRTDIRMAQEKLLNAANDTIALRDIQSEFFEQEASE